MLQTKQKLENFSNLPHFMSNDFHLTKAKRMHYFCMSLILMACQLIWDNSMPRLGYHVHCIYIFTFFV